MNLPGVTRAAVFLLSLEEEVSIGIIRHMNEREVRQIRRVVDGLKPMTGDVLEQVYVMFNNAVKEGWTALPEGDKYLRQLVCKAQGEEAEEWFATDSEEELLEKPVPGVQGPLSALTDVDPEVLRIALNEENPQVAAAVLAHLDPLVAAAVLQGIPTVQQTDLIFRIASLKPISVAAFSDAAHALGGVDLAALPRPRDVDGVSLAATILNEMATVDATSVLERLAEEHPEDAVKLQRAMFTLENLLEADARGLQQLLREVQTDTLLVALKAASEPLKQRLFSCMSTRAAAMLQEEAELLPPMRMSDIEAAQHQIVEVAMRLMSEGKLGIRGRGEEMV